MNGTEGSKDYRQITSKIKYPDHDSISPRKKHCLIGNCNKLNWSYITNANTNKSS